MLVRITLALFVILFLTACENNLPEGLPTTPPTSEGSSGLENITGMEVTGMQLISIHFKNSQDIPKEFTCEGDDISPQFAWIKVPDGTKSFALSMVDPDTPGRTWHHWLLYNIPSSVKEFAKGEYAGIEVVNDFGRSDYGGPCPPSGKHRYIFVIYALDVEDLGTGITMVNYFSRVAEHTIEKAELIGLYQKVR
ncbi:MAG: YbhB/YbcL family Raf kinase inhibitor-like protein [Nanoarchaeota archaeon]